MFLSLIDFTTGYADAVALPSVVSIHVTEGLLEWFSRVGLLKEILTDLGPSFMSGLMRVNTLLTIMSLHTTLYHPMTNKLVKRYNGRLKTMLRRMRQEIRRGYNHYLPPLLSAYREIPQASFGSSPFRIIQGRYVR